MECEGREGIEEQTHLEKPDITVGVLSSSAWPSAGGTVTDKSGQPFAVEAESATNEYTVYLKQAGSGDMASSSSMGSGSGLGTTRCNDNSTSSQQPVSTQTIQLNDVEKLVNPQEQHNYSEETVPDDVLREERLKTLLYNTDHKIGERFDTANLTFNPSMYLLLLHDMHVWKYNTDHARLTQTHTRPGLGADTDESGTAVRAAGLGSAAEGQMSSEQFSHEIDAETFALEDNVLLKMCWRRWRKRWWSSTDLEDNRIGSGHLRDSVLSNDT